jgi:hypothetical protein
VGCSPSLLEFVDQRVLQLVERRENSIGKVFAHLAEDLLGRVQFGTVGWQIEGMHASWPAQLGARDDCPNYPARPQWTPFLTRGADARPEELQALAFHPRQQQKDASAGGGLHRRI